MTRRTARIAGTLRLYDTDDPYFGWSKSGEVELTNRVADQLAQLERHQPIDLQPYRDRWGMWSLYLIDLAR